MACCMGDITQGPWQHSTSLGFAWELVVQKWVCMGVSCPEMAGQSLEFLRQVQPSPELHMAGCTPLALQVADLSASAQGSLHE